MQDLSCWSQWMAGSSAAGNSVAEHASQCIASIQQKKISSRCHQLKGWSWMHQRKSGCSHLRQSPRKGWTTSLFQHVTCITCLLSSLSLHICLKHLPLSFPPPHPYQTVSVPDSETLQRLLQQRPEWEATLRRSMSAQGWDITSPNASEDHKVSKLI